MNFELIDNFMQVGVMLVAAVADIIFWFRQKDRIYIILALEHGCFMMGTLYYVLCSRDFMDFQLSLSAYLSDCAQRWGKIPFCACPCSLRGCDFYSRNEK